MWPLLERAGRVRIEGERLRIDAGDRELGRRIGLDLRAAEQDMCVVLHDAVDEMVLRDGDRVTIYSDFEEEVDADAAGAGYRETPRRVYVPKGVPRLRLGR